MPVGQLAGMCLGIDDKLFERLRWHRWMNRERYRYHSQACNRIQILERIVERPALEQRLVDGRQRAAEQNSVTVRACAGYRGGTQRAAAAADVLDNYGAEQRFHLFHPWACESIEGAAWRKRNHQPNRPRWIGFRAGSAHAGRQHGGTRDEVQEF